MREHPKLSNLRYQVEKNIHFGIPSTFLAFERKELKKK